MPPPPLMGGGGGGGKGSSSFTTAAKVLYDSVQRLGAVKPLESNNKMYAHQLKKIQSQSKRRGGSLGGVSYKVAEFLATQRTPLSSVGPARRPNVHSMAKKVPLLDIPLANTKPHQAASVRLSDSTVREADPRLAAASPLVEPSSVSAPQPLSSDLNVHLSLRQSRPFSAKAVTGSPLPEQMAMRPQEQSSAQPQPSPPDVLITEDRPMFESFTPQEPAATLAAGARVSSAVKAMTSPPLSDATPVPRRQPSLVVPSIAPTPAAETAAAVEGKEYPHTPAEPFSVDSWEQQREKEIERLQQRKQEEENKRLAALLEEEHRTLGNKWVELRTVVVSPSAPSTEEEKLSYKIAMSTSITDALSDFQKLVGFGARAAATVPTAAWFIASKILSKPVIDRFPLQDRFLELLEKSSISPDTKSRIKLRFAFGEDLVAQYHAMDENTRRNLDRPQVKKLVNSLAFNGFWEEAIQLVETSKSRLSDRSGSVELALANVARTLEAGPKAEVAAYVTRSLTAAGRLGREAKLELALLESGPTKVNLLTQLAASPEADERVYAELLKRTSAEKADAMLAEVERRGLNRDDPCILAAIVSSKLKSEDPLEVFAEIERQAAKTGLRGFHLTTALTAAKLSPVKEVLDSSVKVALRLPESRPAHTLRTLFPLLYANNMFPEIVALVDAFSKHVPITRVLPSYAAFANEALLKLGRDPLSSMTVKDSGIAVPEAGAAGSTSSAMKPGPDLHRGQSGRTSVSTMGVGVVADRGTAAGTMSSVASAAASSGDLSSITEKMLSYAKEKQWQKALGVLDMLIQVPDQDLAGNSTAAALTLVYNCALSAAVEDSEVALSVFTLMKERNVSVNATTVNTILSSLSKSSQWEESIPFFDQTTRQQRDMNTYLVMVSLLGKHNKWEEAVRVYDEMKKSNPKPPLTMFTVAIGAIVNHSWADTLRVFQDMLKLHGSAVKDNVVNQVLRSLEQNGRAAEVTMLEKEILKKRKKKK